ncbi:MAG: hypothetical protein JRN68_00715 [Nitrososphaerota archaeon]|jgi:predicted dehydrogenase|nr:hypothetical protein [Nitrososphaerota archaeon]
MVYNLGASGLGHWVRRLQTTLEEKGRDIVLFKAVGTRSYEARKDELQKYGIPQERYYSLESDAPLPDDFFDGLDIVYIASPNRFHKGQTLQAINKKKVTVTEKTFATNRRDFEEVIRRIEEDPRTRVTLGLHYISKVLTREFGRILPALVNDYGLITEVNGTFFEETRDEDAKRTWLFKPENGGIAMDWIHPISIISYTMRAKTMALRAAKSYIVQPLYDKVYPTGFHAIYDLAGEYFQKSASANIRVSKGLEVAHKQLRVTFEKAVVDLNYISTDEEFETGSRGDILISSGDKRQKIAPTGPLSYEPMIEDMMNMVRGGKPTLTLKDIISIYEPEWDLQEEISSVLPIRDRDKIDSFVRAGISHSSAN